MVAGMGFEPHDLRVMSSNSSVFQRFATCEKVAILAGFLRFAFYSVLQNNSTFCNGVELLLNYFSVEKIRLTHYTLGYILFIAWKPTVMSVIR